MVLSETLDEKAIDILIEIVFGKIFPGECETRRATKNDICEQSKKLISEKSEATCQELLDSENSLRCALLESVADYVMKIFTYFFFHCTVIMAR